MFTIQLPPGSVRIPTQADAKSRQAEAKRILTPRGAAVSEDFAALGGALYAAGVTLAAVLPAPHATPDVSAILVVTQWTAGASSESATADEIALHQRAGHPLSVIDIVKLPSGPAVRSIRETEHPIATDDGPANLVVRSVQFQLTSPIGGLVIDVSTAHLRHWPYFASQAALIAETATVRTLRL